MKTIETFRFSKPIPEPEPACVCVVIVQTINSGKVRRIEFHSWDAARQCADQWRLKNRSHLTYRVSVEAL